MKSLYNFWQNSNSPNLEGQFSAIRRAVEDVSLARAGNRLLTNINPTTEFERFYKQIEKSLRHHYRIAEEKIYIGEECANAFNGA